jgi:hypothetical protein
MSTLYEGAVARAMLLDEQVKKLVAIPFEEGFADMKAFVQEHPHAVLHPLILQWSRDHHDDMVKYTIRKNS